MHDIDDNLYIFCIIYIIKDPSISKQFTFGSPWLTPAKHYTWSVFLFLFLFFFYPI